MNKFKVGDKVRCITGGKDHEKTGEGGAGWEEGREFTIVRTTNPVSKSATIYWSSTGSGVYEDWLEAVEPKIPTSNSGLIKWKARTE